jgi:cell division protein FtsB
MNLFSNLPSKYKNLIWQVVIVFVGIYFGFYTINGDRGLLHYLYLTHEIEYAKQVAAKYHNERVKLEHKVHLLSSESLDLDLLDERAKAVLNLMKDDEFIVVGE